MHTDVFVAAAEQWLADLTNEELADVLARTRGPIVLNPLGLLDLTAHQEETASNTGGDDSYPVEWLPPGWLPYRAGLPHHSGKAGR